MHILAPDLVFPYASPHHWNVLSCFPVVEKVVVVVAKLKREDFAKSQNKRIQWPHEAACQMKTTMEFPLLVMSSLGEICIYRSSYFQPQNKLIDSKFL